MYIADDASTMFSIVCDGSSLARLKQLACTEHVCTADRLFTGSHQKKEAES